MPWIVFLSSAWHIYYWRSYVPRPKYDDIVAVGTPIYGKSSQVWRTGLGKKGFSKPSAGLVINAKQYTPLHQPLCQAHTATTCPTIALRSPKRVLRQLNGTKISPWNMHPLHSARVSEAEHPPKQLEIARDLGLGEQKICLAITPPLNCRHERKMYGPWLAKAQMTGGTVGCARSLFSCVQMRACTIFRAAKGRPHRPEW